MEKETMTTKLILNRNSWHYRLAETYCPGMSIEDYHYPTICSYGRKVLFGALFALLFFGMLATGSYGVMDMIIWLTVMVQFGTGIEPGALAGLTVIALFALAVVGFGWGVIRIIGVIADYIGYRWFKWQEQKRAEPETAVNDTIQLIIIAYRSFKDKVCLKIGFKD